ncbi:MAG TPA: Rid family hydrolase [Candidatus Baltobacterales bacterium]|nr:Rid family hydrolase [Candidatus Baltobacterales bacterium]
MTRRHRDGRGWEQQAGYSRAVRRFGHIAVSGTTATGADGRAVHLGDTYRQTLVALEGALSAVRALGGTVDDVVRTRVYLAPGADWKEAGRAHAEVMGSVAPANTMLYVANLIGGGFLVEVELEARTATP